MSRTDNRNSIIQRFGEKIRTLRLSRNLTLNDVAQACGYSSHGYISELETGKKIPTAELVVLVARLFEVSTDDLLLDERDLPTTLYRDL